MGRLAVMVPILDLIYYRQEGVISINLELLQRIKELTNLQQADFFILFPRSTKLTPIFSKTRLACWVSKKKLTPLLRRCEEIPEFKVSRDLDETGKLLSPFKQLWNEPQYEKRVLFTHLTQVTPEYEAVCDKNNIQVIRLLNSDIDYELGLKILHQVRDALGKENRDSLKLILDNDETMLANLASSLRHETVLNHSVLAIAREMLSLKEEYSELSVEVISMSARQLAAELYYQDREICPKSMRNIAQATKEYLKHDVTLDARSFSHPEWSEPSGLVDATFKVQHTYRLALQEKITLQNSVLVLFDDSSAEHQSAEKYREKLKEAFNCTLLLVPILRNVLSAESDKTFGDVKNWAQASQNLELSCKPNPFSYGLFSSGLSAALEDAVEKNSQKSGRVWCVRQAGANNS